MALITLDKSAYEHNLRVIAGKAGGFEKIICVLKNNAYGHGVGLVAPVARDLGVNFVALKNESEAAFLQGFFKHILILSHRAHGRENPDFIYALNDKNDLAKFKKGSRIHLKIDTGMHRNGVFIEDLPEIFDKAKRYEIYIEGLFTHFARADELDGSYFAQKKCFENAKKRALNLSSQRLIFHSHNSAALFRCEKLPENELCRVGLAQFGYNEFKPNLRRVLKLYAHKLSSRTLKIGESVGYGGRFTLGKMAENALNLRGNLACSGENSCENSLSNSHENLAVNLSENLAANLAESADFKGLKELKIAAYDLGYADGLFRYNGDGILETAEISRLSSMNLETNLDENLSEKSRENLGKNLSVNSSENLDKNSSENSAKFKAKSETKSGEKRVRLLGRMSMDSFSCEDMGEQICVIDDARIWAKFFGTIEYEILTKLSPFLPRIWV